MKGKEKEDSFSIREAEICETNQNRSRSIESGSKSISALTLTQISIKTSKPRAKKNPRNFRGRETGLDADFSSSKWKLCRR